MGSLAGAGAARAETATYTWRNVAIGGGGFVTGVTYHPHERNLLYARTDVGGAYRWDAAGERWIALNDALGRESADLYGVLSVGLDPNDANRVYLACGSYTSSWAASGAMLASTDRGATWQRHPLPIKLGANENGRSTGERLGVDPRNGAKLLLGTTRNGLWRSDDYAATWRQVTAFPAERVTFVLFTSAATGGAGEIYAGGGGMAEPALYRSADGGSTWTAVPGQPRGLIVHHAVCDAQGTLYLAYANGLGPNGVTDGAVWKYERAGDRWTNISPVKPDPAAKDVFGYAGVDLDPARPGTIVASTLDRWRFRDEIFRTTDGGLTWKPMLAGARWDNAGAEYVAALKPHWMGSVAIDPFDGSRAWFITGYGVWSTTSLNASDVGAAVHWKFADAGLEETVIDELTSPPQGAPLLSAIGDLGGFRHDDLDRSPPQGMYRPFYGSGPSIAFAANDPAIVVRTHHGPTRGAISRDGGTTWQDFASAPPAAVSNGPGAIAIGADAQTIVWLPKGSGPFYSTDRGATWTRSTAEFVSARDYTIDRPVADPADASTFYHYDQRHGRLYVSTDRGASFALASLVPTRGGLLQPQPGVAGWVWLPTGAGLYVSHDRGYSFARCEKLDAAHHIAFGRAAKNAGPPTIFASAKIHNQEGIYRSDDGAQTWVLISDAQHAFGWVRGLAADPRVAGRVYVGTSGRGIFYGENAPESSAGSAADVRR